MDISKSEVIAIVRKWESEGTTVNAYLETIHPRMVTDLRLVKDPRLVMRFNGCKVVALPDRIGLTTESNQFEVGVELLPYATFKYSESEGENAGKSILEVRAEAWRFVLFE